MSETESESTNPDSGTTFDTGRARLRATSAALDHATDGICAVGIVVAAIYGAASPQVVGGLASIALGKRLMGDRSSA